jgi:hypothetical protein
MTTSTSAPLTTRIVTLEDESNGQRADAATLGSVPGLGNVTAISISVGPCPTRDLLLTIGGLHLTTATPAVVMTQPRQGVNRDFAYPDQFGVQVIETAMNSLMVKIRRLDSNSGWGQDLHLDILIIDSPIRG